MNEFEVTTSNILVNAKERRRRLAQVYSLILSWSVPEQQSSCSGNHLNVIENTTKCVTGAEEDPGIRDHTTI